VTAVKHRPSETENCQSRDLTWWLDIKSHQWASRSCSTSSSSSSADSALNSLYHKCVSVFIWAWPSFTSCHHHQPNSTSLYHKQGVY